MKFFFQVYTFSVFCGINPTKNFAGLYCWFPAMFKFCRRNQKNEQKPRMDLTPVRPPPHLTRSQEENGPHLGGLPGTADRVTCLAGGPHFSCESNRQLKRVYMTRWLPHRGGGSHLPGVPHLHVNRPLFSMQKLCREQKPLCLHLENYSTGATAESGTFCPLHQGHGCAGGRI